MGPGFSRGVLFPLILILSILVVFVFFLHESIPAAEIKMDVSKMENLNPDQHQHNSDEMHLNLAQPLTRTKYNLMEDTHGDNWAKRPLDKYLNSSVCTIEYANEKKLQQDHPCLIQLIQDKFLLQPASKELPYVLNHPETIDPSNGQANDIREILKNKTKGFFVESGGYDGEFLSNTFFMERYLDWNGLLIEADKKSFSKLFSRNRKAFSLPNCISTKPYPIKVLFNGLNNAGSSIVETLEANNNTSESSEYNETVYTVQCFPFYSMLLAVGRTEVDYFGLDVEGSEYKILATIPWHKVTIKTMTVEWNHIPEGEPALTRLMERNNYKKFRMISLNYSREVIYIHKSIVFRKEKETI